MLKIWLQTLTASFGVTFLGIFISIITARGLGPDGRGLLASAMLITSLVAGVSQFGFGQAYVYLGRIHRNWDWSRIIQLSCVSAAVISCSLAWFALESTAKIDSLNQASIVALCIVTTVGGVLLNATQHDASLKSHNIAKVFSTASLLLGLALAWEADAINVQNVLWIQLASSIFLLTLALRWTARDLTNKSSAQTAGKKLNQLATFVIYSTKLHLTVLSGLLISNIDKLYLYFTGSLKDFGIYSVAYATSRLIGTFQETLSTTLYAKFAGQQDMNSSSGIHQAFRITFLPMLAIALAAGAAGPFAMELLFGKSFSSAGIIFSILLIECVLGSSSWLLAQQFNATGRPGIVFARQAISAIPVLALLPLVPTNDPLPSIAAILLLSSFIRLLTTIILYQIEFNTPFAKILPTKNDIRIIKSIITKKS